MFKEEKKLHKQGYKCIVGLDEAGRGPLAGSVVAGAVAYDCSIWGDLTSRALERIRDSKKLSAKQREEWYKILTSHPDIKWGAGIVSEKIIDKINILQATKLAMVKAMRDLERRFNVQADFLIIDGNFTLNFQDFEVRPRNLTRSDLVRLRQKAVVKGDEKVFSCAAASIIAKVTRDRMMMKMHKKYPQYGFGGHKGYGTREHLSALRKYGPCGIHRKSFGPVKSITNN